MRLVVIALVFFACFSTHAVYRFEKAQLQFVLHPEGMPTVSCSHIPLKESGPNAPDLPWWFVVCGERQFTVDAWFEMTSLSSDLQSLRFLFHIKESVSSSGLKNTQFNTQTTDFIVQKTAVYGISSFLDVDNGLGDLQITARAN